MKYDFSEDEKLREVLQSIISLQNINIEIVGCWIWGDGETYEHKDKLKALGFRWAREKKKWYFHTEAFRKRSKRNKESRRQCFRGRTDHIKLLDLVPE